MSDGPVDRYPRNTRYALLLALGEYRLAEIPKSQQALLLRQLADWYRDDPSSGVHGATGWLLRKWGQPELVRAVDQTPIPYSQDREITWEELIAFNPTYVSYMRRSESWREAAGAGADWYDAVGFCRWLGQQSGLSEPEQAYASPDLLDTQQHPLEPHANANLDANGVPSNWTLELSRRGFRLPTESATRATPEHSGDV